VKYPLPQSFFDKKTLDRTESKVMGTIKARCGYNLHTASAILYAPTSYAGGGFVHWYTLQGEGQIQQFLKHWRTNTMISRMLRIDLAWSQWQSGLSRPILTATSTPLPHLECRWLRSLRTFLHYSNSHLHVHQPFTQPIERIGDFHIMDYAIRSGLFDEEALRLINYCRLYLHVTTVSELFNADGTSSILPDMLSCRRAPWMDPTTVITLQKKQAIIKFNTNGSDCVANGAPTTVASPKPFPFANGFVIPRSCAYAAQRTSKPASCPYYITGSTTAIGNIYRTLVHATQLFRPNRATTWVPTPTLLPVDALLNDAFNVVLSHTPWRHFQSPAPLRSAHHHYDFADYVRTLPLWEQEILEHIEFILTPEELMDLLAPVDTSPPTLLLVSDGSDTEEAMSFGWILGTQSGRPLVQNYRPGFGIPSSHRAKAWGMISGARFLLHYTIYTRHPIPEHVKVESMSDNKGLIHRATDRKTYTNVYANSTLAPDWDITEEIHKTFAQL
jgi:hypothetical protein